MKNISKLLLIAILLISFISCSSDDDGNIDNSTQTFLEKHAGSTWVIQDDYENDYLRFINNLISPIEEWTYFEDQNCYFYYLIDFTDDFPLEITENLENKLEFSFTFPEENVDFKVTLTITGNTLKIKSEQFENGNVVDVYIETFINTSIDVDGFVICDD